MAQKKHHHSQANPAVLMWASAAVLAMVASLPAAARPLICQARQKRTFIQRLRCIDRQSRPVLLWL